MNKRKAFTFVSVILGVAILSAAGVMYFRYPDAPIIAEPLDGSEFSIPETNIPQKEETGKTYTVPAIKTEAKDIIEEPMASKPEDNMPPPEITETINPDGTIVQTPNWEAQKELAPGTDLNNPDSQPEYVKPSASESAASSQSSVSKSGTDTSGSGSSTGKEQSGSSSAEDKGNKGGDNNNPGGNNAGNTNSTPKNGDKKVIDGVEYEYWPPFGWVKCGDGGTTEYIDVELSGEKVGH